MLCMQRRFNKDTCLALQGDKLKKSVDIIELECEIDRMMYILLFTVTQNMINKRLVIACSRKFILGYRIL